MVLPGNLRLVRPVDRGRQPLHHRRPLCRRKRRTLRRHLAFLNTVMNANPRVARLVR